MFSPLAWLPKVVGRSRIRLGSGLEIRGVPAILVGVAAIVGTAGFVRIVERAVPAVPETLRESRELLRAIRTPERAELLP